MSHNRIILKTRGQLIALPTPAKLTIRDYAVSDGPFLDGTLPADPDNWPIRKTVLDEQEAP